MPRNKSKTSNKRHHNKTPDQHEITQSIFLQQQRLRGRRSCSSSSSSSSSSSFSKKTKYKSLDIPITTANVEYPLTRLPYQKHILRLDKDATPFGSVPFNAKQALTTRIGKQSSSSSCSSSSTKNTIRLDFYEPTVQTEETKQPATTATTPPISSKNYHHNKKIKDENKKHKKSTILFSYTFYRPDDDDSENELDVPNHHFHDIEFISFDEITANPALDVLTTTRPIASVILANCIQRYLPNLHQNHDDPFISFQRIIATFICDTTPAIEECVQMKIHSPHVIAVVRHDPQQQQQQQQQQQRHSKNKKHRFPLLMPLHYWYSTIISKHKHKTKSIQIVKQRIRAYLAKLEHSVLHLQWDAALLSDDNNEDDDEKKIKRVFGEGVWCIPYDTYGKEYDVSKMYILISWLSDEWSFSVPRTEFVFFEQIDTNTSFQSFCYGDGVTLTNRTNFVHKQRTCIELDLSRFALTHDVRQPLPTPSKDALLTYQQLQQTSTELQMELRGHVQNDTLMPTVTTTGLPDRVYDQHVMQSMRAPRMNFHTHPDMDQIHKKQTDFSHGIPSPDDMNAIWAHASMVEDLKRGGAVEIIATKYGVWVIRGRYQTVLDMWQIITEKYKPRVFQDSDIVNYQIIVRTMLNVYYRLLTGVFVATTYKNSFKYFKETMSTFEAILGKPNKVFTEAFFDDLYSFSFFIPPPTKDSDEFLLDMVLALDKIYGRDDIGSLETERAKIVKEEGSVVMDDKSRRHMYLYLLDVIFDQAFFECKFIYYPQDTKTQKTLHSDIIPEL